MSKRRVVVTGIGAITPLACGIDKTWLHLINGKSGLSRITAFDVETSEIACKIAGQVKDGTGDGEFTTPVAIEIDSNE